MKEHPDYKYRPRRKPKPMNHNGSNSKKEVAKYSFPLPVPFIPPGFDPCSFSAMARSIFAQTAAPNYPHLHQESNATPAGLFGAHNSSGGLSSDHGVGPHNLRHPTQQVGAIPPLIPSFTPTVAFSHQDLAALFCMQQKNHYEKLLRDHQEANIAAENKRRRSSSSSIDESKGKNLVVNAQQCFASICYHSQYNANVDLLLSPC